MSRATVFTSSQSCVRRRSWLAKRAASTIELLAVIVIPRGLAAMTTLACRSYMTSVNIALGTNRTLTIDERIRTDFDLTLKAHKPPDNKTLDTKAPADACGTIFRSDDAPLEANYLDWRHLAASPHQRQRDQGS